MLPRVLLLVLLPISQVWSSRGPPDIAFGKPTSQSSTASGHVSSGPVSGHNASSCSQTRKEGGSWWKVDLGDYFSITNVALTSKRGTSSDGLHDFTIEVLGKGAKTGKICTTVPKALQPGETRNFRCRWTIGGTAVLIRNKGLKRRSLVLCEVRVIGRRGWHHHKGGGGNRGGFGDSGARPGVEIQGPLPSEGFNANGGSALPNLGFTGTGGSALPSDAQPANDGEGPLPNESFTANGGGALPNRGFTGTGGGALPSDAQPANGGEGPFPSDGFTANYVGALPRDDKPASGGQGLTANGGEGGGERGGSWHHHKGGGGNRGGFDGSGGRSEVERQDPLPSEGFTANGGGALPNHGFTGTGGGALPRVDKPASGGQSITANGGEGGGERGGKPRKKGSRCFSSCFGVKLGNYQSCHGCNVYLTCVWNTAIDDRPCSPGLAWDDTIKMCIRKSTTCGGG